MEIILFYACSYFFSFQCIVQLDWSYFYLLCLFYTFRRCCIKKVCVQYLHIDRLIQWYNSVTVNSCKWWICCLLKLVSMKVKLSHL